MFAVRFDAPMMSATNVITVVKELGYLHYSYKAIEWLLVTDKEPNEEFLSALGFTHIIILEIENVGQ